MSNYEMTEADQLAAVRWLNQQIADLSRRLRIFEIMRDGFAEFAGVDAAVPVPVDVAKVLLREAVADSPRADPESSEQKAAEKKLRKGRLVARRTRPDLADVVEGEIWGRPKSAAAQQRQWIWEHLGASGRARQLALCELFRIPRGSITRVIDHPAFRFDLDGYVIRNQGFADVIAREGNGLVGSADSGVGSTAGGD